MREIIFDTETTGLEAASNDRIIEIGAVELENRFITGRSFHVYINPDGRQVHPEALAVHGISNDDLADKPLFKAVVQDWFDFVGDATLIAHNAGFDVGFFNAEFARLGFPPIDPDRIVDSLQIARRRHPMGPNSLDALCKRYGIDNSRREKHGALLDSELLAEVYIELVGGKQAALGLEPVAQATGPASSASERAGDDPHESRGRHHLPQRLSSDEAAAHLVDGAFARRQALFGWANKKRAVEPPLLRQSGCAYWLGAWTLSLGLLFGHPLAEHLQEVDRIDHQRRETAIARCFGDDLAGKREQQARAFDEQCRQHVLLREVDDAEHAAIGQLDIEKHLLFLFGLGGQDERYVVIRLAHRIGLHIDIDVDGGRRLARPAATAVRRGSRMTGPSHTASGR